jgi:GTPase SAR1 family protein
LDDLDDWIEGVYSVTGKIPIEFLGNKIDLKDQIQISEDEMTQAARAYESPFRFTSAKAGVKVEDAFQSLAQRVAKERYARKIVRLVPHDGDARSGRPEAREGQGLPRRGRRGRQDLLDPAFRPRRVR